MAEEMKLLMTASTTGHIEKFHLPYLREFKRMGWEVHAACGGENRELPYVDKMLPFPLKKRLTAAENFRASCLLRKEIKRERYDLIIAHTSLAAFFTRLAVVGLKNRPKTVNVMHGYLFDEATPFFRASILKAAELLTAPWTDLVLTMNAWDDTWARAHRAGKRVEHIPGMGVDEKTLLQVEPAAFEKAPEDFILIYPAEFSKRKSQEVLIRGMALLPERVKLLLPGEGEYLEDCKRLAKELNLTGRVFFPGYVEDIGGLLKRADAAVSASRSEGLPFNILEGMLLDLPVIASRVKGHTDLVTDGENGYLYDYGDKTAFARSVKKLLEDPEQAKRLGAAGRERAKNYTLEAVLPQVMEKYTSLFQ